ncbi:MAG: hypothetical protein KF774_14050 [Planctomyces sp.]|nr:hypothetical protein [Planctomyces sp.]
MYVRLRVFAALSLALPCGAAFAEIAPLIEVIPAEKATADFAFASVPRPSASDAASVARLSIVAGQADANSGSVKTLQDGQLPENDDQPARNVFFAPGTRGGRVLVELREPADIQQINTYSWHPADRAPQVYRVYGDAGDSDKRVPARRRDSAADAGWTLIATVDTRPVDGAPGGQHGVSIAGSEEQPIGRHRRLLFEIERTQDRDQWGLTFFSELDVVDGNEYEPQPEIREIATLDIDGGYTITFDTTDTPELKSWVDSKLQPVCREWYPKIVAMFPSDGYDAPRTFSVTFHADMDGVAFCRGTEVHCAGRWFRQNLEGEAAGAVVHEMVHVVQQYGRTRGGNRNPGWLVEGVADYVRWCLYEPESLRPRPDPERAKYTDSYRTTGAFLAWIADRHGEDAVRMLNTAMREGTYAPHVWERATGATVDELWETYAASLRGK